MTDDDNDIDYDEIDPGVRKLVRWVRRWGFDTSDSGDGVSKPAEWYESGEAMRVPHVFAMSHDIDPAVDDRDVIGEWVGVARAMRVQLLGDAAPKAGQEITVSYNAADKTLLFALYGFTDADVPDGETHG